MDKHFLQIFLQIFLTRTVITSDIFQLEFNELKSLLENPHSSHTFHKLENVLANDGAFVSIWPEQDGI